MCIGRSSAPASQCPAHCVYIICQSVRHRCLFSLLCCCRLFSLAYYHPITFKQFSLLIYIQLLFVFDGHFRTATAMWFLQFIWNPVIQFVIYLWELQFRFPFYNWSPSAILSERLFDSVFFLNNDEMNMQRCVFFIADVSDALTITSEGWLNIYVLMAAYSLMLIWYNYNELLTHPYVSNGLDDDEDKTVANRVSMPPLIFFLKISGHEKSWKITLVLESRGY